MIPLDGGENSQAIYISIKRTAQIRRYRNQKTISSEPIPN